MTTEFTMDMEAMKMLAEASGRAAADKIAETLREEFKQQIKEALVEHESRIEERMTGFFGKKSGEEHLVQHARIDRFLQMVDRMSDNFFGAFIRNFVTGILALLVLGWLAWGKFKIMG